MAQVLDEETPDIVLSSIFKYYDKDNSGALDKKEFRHYLKNLGFGNDLQTATLHALADDDNNGDEFQFLCSVRDIFTKCDKDGNGSITWDEWKKEMKEQGRDDKETKELFDAANKNGGKTITFDEFYHSLVDEL